MNDTATVSALAVAPRMCDGTSVGVDITDGTGRHLLQRRVKYPDGLAPIAGHVDEHPNRTAAIHAEASHELGIGLKDLAVLIDDKPLTNACRRSPVDGGPQHRWTVFAARAVGTPTANGEETAETGWYTSAQLQQLADQTIAVARGALGLPVGLEPVWVLLYAALGTITASPAALVAVARMAGWPPSDPGGRNPNQT
jgi:hypothetical protein